MNNLIIVENTNINLAYFLLQIYTCIVKGKREFKRGSDVTYRWWEDSSTRFSLPVIQLQFAEVKSISFLAPPNHEAEIRQMQLTLTFPRISNLTLQNSIKPDPPASTTPQSHLTITSPSSQHNLTAMTTPHGVPSCSPNTRHTTRNSKSCVRFE